MADAQDILVSIDGKYVSKLLNGTKKVELRRRPINVPEGSRVWIYSKIPEGRVNAMGVVSRIYKGAPHNIWERYHHVSGIDKSDFLNYFDGTEEGCAIEFEYVRALEDSISLETLRSELKRFQPPQFFKFLLEDSAELKLFRRSTQFGANALQFVS